MREGEARAEPKLIRENPARREPRPPHGARQLLYRVGSHKISRDATNPRETDL